jgi:hypothetical protein
MGPKKNYCAGESQQQITSYAAQRERERERERQSSGASTNQRAIQYVNHLSLSITKHIFRREINSSAPLIILEE